MHYYTQQGIEDTNKSEAFTYDAWFRLKAAQTINVNSNTAGTWSLTWGYDRLGNRKQQTLVNGNIPPPGIGQPSFAIDETTNRINGFGYDNAGNLTSDPAFTYTYDGVNRMKQAQQIASPNTVTSSTYFGASRIKSIVSATTTRYVYSGSKPIAEYVNGSTTPSKEYIYAGGQLLATIAGSATTYHHPDHLSNRAETDAAGTPVRSFGHFPYGEVWYETGTTDPLKFTSYVRDSGTGQSGLDYAVFRFASSGLARFMSPDPLAGNILSPQSLNRYAYVTNDPVNMIDPLGLAGGNWKCRILNTGNCAGGNYAGWTSNATAGMGAPGCALDGQTVDCGLTHVAEDFGGIATLCYSFMGCGTHYVNFNGQPGGPDWVKPGAGDPELVAAGCLVNISRGGWGDMVWCPGWDGMSFNWGGRTEFQISNLDSDVDSIVVKHKASRVITPVVYAKPPITKDEAHALCTIAAVNASNGTGGSVLNPGVSSDTGYGVYTSAKGTPKLGDQTVAGNGAAGFGALLSYLSTYGGVYSGCMGALGF